MGLAAAAHVKGSWINQLRAGLDKVAAYDDKLSELRNGLPSWMCFIQRNGRRAAPITKQHMIRHCHDTAPRVPTTGGPNGACEQPAAPPPIRAWPCGICGQTFATRAQLATHAF